MAKDYYKILGVTHNSSPEEIKAAYKKLAIKWHPDKFARASEAEKKNAEEKMKDINEAYDALKNSTQSKINFNTSNSSAASNSSNAKPKSKYAKEEDIFDIDLESLINDSFGIKSNSKSKAKTNKSKDSLWFDSDKVTKDFFGI